MRTTVVGLVTPHLLRIVDLGNQAEKGVNVDWHVRDAMARTMRELGEQYNAPALVEAYVGGLLHHPNACSVVLSDCLGLRMLRKSLPLFLLVAITSSASAENQLQQVISDLLGGNSSNTDDPSVARCESLQGQQRTCNVPSGYRAEYVRRLSNTTCTQGESLFIRSHEVVVAQGCRAELRLVEIATAGTSNSGGACQACCPKGCAQGSPSRRTNTAPYTTSGY